jgi:hypothetical protein|tara:strand:+ start:229 stop:453 length:225 start_codon:yes stop_codon:yes gene_type:complete
MDDNSEIAEKITAMETEQAESLRIKQAALQKMNEADAMIQRQQGYLIALRELLQSSSSDNGEAVVLPEAGEVIL